VPGSTLYNYANLVTSEALRKNVFVRYEKLIMEAGFKTENVVAIIMLLIYIYIYIYIYRMCSVSQAVWLPLASYRSYRFLRL
jgi:hypothetical protein